MFFFDAKQQEQGGTGVRPYREVQEGGVRERLDSCETDFSG